MKRSIVLILFILSSIEIYTQEISYIIPDIGSPGMNTYIEIIAPHDASAPFGSDGIYLNNPNDEIKIVLDRLADTNLVTFGPLIVSWSGRMISTQIFVEPDVEPNQYDWERLSSEFIISFHVEFQDRSSNSVRFYILDPYPLGDVRFVNENRLGQDNLGKRSPRGAMIVDSLILKDSEYFVSTQDCDLNTPGNQGFLPFTLLSKGPIKGFENTIINVSSNSINGGPGGGGGGGKYCDRTFTSGSGDDGGAGFTGGGPGGRNSSTMGNNKKTPGSGTGSNGTGNVGGLSLNGVFGGNSPSGFYESAGGGTGHPFGLSGDGCNSGSGCDPVGGFGGGSGYRQLEHGGSGGYATVGGSSSINNGGKIHGNVMLVPFAGGSGAASGNPQFIDDCSGNGGGGGGALSIFAPYLENLQLIAKGANGGSGNNNDAFGGSGSGGGLSVQCKIANDEIYFDVAGGNNGKSIGGAGRIRYDVMNLSGVASRTGLASIYKGITTDTTKYIGLDSLLVGERARESTVSEDVQIFMKSQNGDWYELNPANITYPSWRTWQAELDFFDNDSCYYLVVASKVTDPTDGRFNDRPTHVMSQAAANFLFIPKFPDIASDRSTHKNFITCSTNVAYDTVTVFNTAEGILALYMDQATFRNGTTGFELVSPTDTTLVAGLGDTSIIVKYTYQSGDSRSVGETLEFPHNVTTKENPWSINFSFVIDTVDYFWRSVDPTFDIDSLYLGHVCLGEEISKEFALYNESSIPVELLNLFTENTTDFYVENHGKSIIDATAQDDSTRIKVGFNGSVSNTGLWSTTLYYELDICGRIDSIKVFVDVINSDLVLYGNPDFGKSVVNISKIRQLTITNEGNAPAFIEDIPTLTSPYRVVSINPPVPTVLMPGESLILMIEFKPPDQNTYTEDMQVLAVKTDSTCDYQLDINFTGFGGESDILVEDRYFSFGPWPYCDEVIEIIKVTNKPSALEDLTIENIGSMNPNEDYFNITQIPLLPITLAPGESMEIEVRFKPGLPPNGMKFASFIIYTDSQSEPEVTVLLEGEREGLEFSSTPAPVYDFGDIPMNLLYQMKFQLQNDGELDRRLIAIETNDPGFTFSPSLLDFAGSGAWHEITIDAIFDTPGLHCSEVRFVFDQPCRDTLKYEVCANVLEGNLFLPRDSLIYGSITPCTTVRDTFWVINNGETDLELSQVHIVGPDAPLFVLDNPVIIGTPLTVLQGDTAEFTVVYDPTSAPDGDKLAFAEITSFVNNNTQIDSVVLTGKKEVNFNIDPLVVDFGTVIIGYSGNGQINFTNDGAWDIEIETMTQAINNGIFTLFPQTFTNEPVINGSPVSVDVTFVPIAEQDYSDTVHAKVLIGSCVENRTIILLGKGKAGETVQFMLPDTLVDPRTDNLIIPVYGKLVGSEPGTKIKLYDLEFSVEIEPQVFYPSGINYGELNQIRSELNKKIVEFDIDFIELDEFETVIAEITGFAVLGNVNTGDLIFLEDEFNWDSKGLASFYEFENGKIETMICSKGGDRLLTNNDFPFLTVMPNPAEDEIKVNVIVSEIGEQFLELVDIAGNIISLQKWSNSLADPREYEFVFDLNNISSGFYYLIYRSSNRTMHSPVYIIK